MYQAIVFFLRHVLGGLCLATICTHVLAVIPQPAPGSPSGVVRGDPPADRSSDANGAPSTPASVVNTMLAQHLAGNMGFSAATVEAKKAYLSAHLMTLMRDYFAKPQSADEVPAVDGDPWTDSQEYPSRFTVGTVVTEGKKSWVAVRFAGGGAKPHSVQYLLVQSQAGWRIDDVRFGYGPALSALLR